MLSVKGHPGHHRLVTLAQKAAFRGADMALHVPLLREFLVSRLLERLSRAYAEKQQDRDALIHDRWFALHLRSFLKRLLRERPSAARAILRFVETWVEDMSRRLEAAQAGLVHPVTVVIEPTDRCNLHCPGCYADSIEDGADLPYERILRIVEEVVEMGVSLITISGGEPLLRERSDHVISRLAEAFPERGFLVYTNGTLIDDEIARRLGGLGNVFPAVSVEGFEHHTDARRGRGIYERNRRARSLLAEEGVMTGFSATVTRLNVESICTDRFIETRIAEGDLFGWFFILQPIGRSPRSDLMVTAQQRALLRETVYRWRQEDRPIFLGDFWNDGHLVGGCMAGGRYYFHIYANGDVSPCVFAPVVCDNVFDIIAGRSAYRSLADCVNNHPVFRAFRAEQKEVKDRNRPCMLIDHPQAFRRCLETPGCRPAANMPPGYADGAIARAIDAAAREWRAYCATKLPPLPAESEAFQAVSGSVGA